MLLSRPARNRISAIANFLDRCALRLRRVVRDSTPRRKRGAKAEAERIE